MVGGESDDMSGRLYMALDRDTRPLHGSPSP